MGDFLAELFDQFDPEEQAGIRAAEEATKGILEEGTAAVRDRQLAAGSSVLTGWVLEPEDDARADAAGVVFAAYINALWRQTDPGRSESIQEFGAKVDKLVAPVLARYGREGEGNIAELREKCWRSVQIVLQRSTLSEASGAVEQGNVGNAQLDDDLVISVKPDSILQFLESWRIRQRRKRDLQAWYRRRHRRTMFEADREENLLRGARGWAEPVMRELVSEVQDVFELKQRVAKQTFDKFIEKDSYFWERFSEFASALLEEEWPSLEDHAIAAMADKAAAAEPAPSAAAPKRRRDIAGPRSGTEIADVEKVEADGRMEGAMGDVENRSAPECDRDGNCAAELFVIAYKEIIAESEKDAAGFKQMPPTAVRRVSLLDILNAIWAAWKIAPSEVTPDLIENALYLLCRQYTGGVELDPMSCQAAGVDYLALADQIRGSLSRWAGNRGEPTLASRLPQIAARVANRVQQQADGRLPKDGALTTDTDLLGLPSIKPEVIDRSPISDTQPLELQTDIPPADQGMQRGAKESPDATQHPLVIRKRGKPIGGKNDKQEKRRGDKRSAWLDSKLTQHPDWSSDQDIAAHWGPSYNTIQRYRSGAASNQDLSVRKGFAKAFHCEITEVPD